MSRGRVPIVTALVVLSGVLAPAGLRAQRPGQQPVVTDTAQLRQQAESQLGRSVTQGEILDRLRQSGMTRAQARARLQQMGYDPGLADKYYDALEGGGDVPGGAPSKDFLKALERMGVARAGGADSTGVARDTLALDTLGVDTTAEAVTGEKGKKQLQIFGHSLFTRKTNEFAPVQGGPVDPSYKLGPGDNLNLVLTGDVEQAYDLQVTRDGFIVIPDVGQVMVNGLTMGQLDDLLYSRIGRVYSGVRRGAGATTHFTVSLGRVRASQVYLVGEVARPGAYQVNALSTVFDALYRAGGPSDRGSYRRVEVRRGGMIVQRVDLYDYLLRGDSHGDIRLEQGDIVFVPVATRMVRVDGAVRRPAIFELLPTDGLRDAIAYAGGLEADAVARRVQIDRILPPEKRLPGVDRVLVDVDVAQLTGSGVAAPLQDGDVVHVFAVSDERRNRVVLTGGVHRPGIYEWSPGTTLWQVIDRAQGLDERAYTARAHVFRLNPLDGSRRLIHTPLFADSTGKGLVDMPLSDRDSVVVYSVARLTNPAFVAIDGFVKKPGTYALADGMTLQDLILSAGGFIRGARLGDAEVARLPDAARRSDTTAFVLRVALGAPASKESPNAVPGQGDADVPNWIPSAAEFRLKEGDRVFVRKADGYTVSRQVLIAGEVVSPGKYVLRDRQERLADVLARAGGPTHQAYVQGLQIYRSGILLPTDAERALRDPRSRFNVVLEGGDSVVLPAYDGTVRVTGDVAFESRVLYRPGKGLDYYIQQAGGFGERAAKGRTSVSYANGERAISRHMLLFSRSPEIRPGATVFVPAEPESKSGFNWDTFLSRTLGIVSTTVTLMIALKQLK